MQFFFHSHYDEEAGRTAVMQNSNSSNMKHTELTYECPVEGCHVTITDDIPKGMTFICGFPRHVCDKCDEEGWELLSGHGGPDELTKRKEKAPDRVEEYEEDTYTCAVEGCGVQIVDKIPVNGMRYICGYPRHVCDKCDENGWYLLSGHGGSDELKKKKEKKEQM